MRQYIFKIKLNSDICVGSVKLKVITKDLVSAIDVLNKQFPGNVEWDLLSEILIK